MRKISGLHKVEVRFGSRHKKKKLYMCFVEIEKAFDRVGDWKERFTRIDCESGDESVTEQRRKQEWDLSYLKNFWYKSVYIKDLCCRRFFAITVNVITENAREELRNEICLQMTWF